jgi:hypothetical protein
MIHGSKFAGNHNIPNGIPNAAQGKKMKGVTVPKLPNVHLKMNAMDQD